MSSKAGPHYQGFLRGHSDKCSVELIQNKLPPGKKWLVVCSSGIF